MRSAASARYLGRLKPPKPAEPALGDLLDAHRLEKDLAALLTIVQGFQGLLQVQGVVLRGLRPITINGPDPFRPVAGHQGQGNRAITSPYFAGSPHAMEIATLL